jgi:signal transduction histidine kinase
VRLLDADYGTIALVDEESGGVRVEAGYNLPPGLLGRRLGPGEWLADLALNRVGPVLIGPDDPQPVGLPDYHAPGHSHIAAPIWWQDRLIGVFSLSSGRPEQRFSRADLDTLALLARHAAVAIENAGLYSALQERFSQVEGIGAVGTALIEERDLDRVLETVAEQIIGLLGADGCSIFLLDPDEAARIEGEELELAVVLGAGMEVLRGRRLDLNDSYTGNAVRSGQPVLIENLQDGPAGNATRLREEGIDQLLSVPLQTSERMVGALNAYGKRGKVFGQHDVEVMTLFAHQAAVAIENARLHEQGRILAVAEERNRMAREIHDTLAQGFTGIILQLQVAEALLEGEESTARARIERAQDLARSSLREARRSVWNLRPSSLQGRTLAAGLRNHLEEWSMQTGIASGMTVEGEERPLTPETEETLLRVAQEALNNTYKHAGARRVEVTLTVEPLAVLLAVCDDGAGIGGATPRNDGGGFGLVSMRERVKRLNGRLDIESAPGQGTCVQVSVVDHGPPARREPGSVPG